MRYTLLSVGTNHALLGLRNTVHAKAGYAVIPVRTGAEAEKMIRHRHIHAVIVGHSLSLGLKERIVAAAKQRQLPVVVLHASGYEPPLPLRMQTCVVSMAQRKLRRSLTNCSRRLLTVNGLVETHFNVATAQELIVCMWSPHNEGPMLGPI